MPDIGPLSPVGHQGNAPNPPSSNSQSPGPGIGGVLRKLHIPWPEADENALREAAVTWHRLAEAIRDNYGHANSAASSLTSNNEGAAIAAFESYWAKFGGSKGALLLGADACDAMSKGCDQYADSVAAVKRRIEEAAAGITGTLVIGTVGAFFTFGATEAAADVLAAEIAASAAEWIVELGLDLSTTLGLISDAVADAVAVGAQITADAVDSEAASSALGGFLAGAAGGVGGTTLTEPLRQLTGQGPISPAQLAKDLVVAGLTNGTGSMLGKLGELSAPQLSRLLSNAADSAITSDPQLSVSLQELSKQVAGTTGKVSTSVLSSAASQLIVSQHLDAMGFSQDQLQELLKRAAESNMGERGGK